MASESDTTSVGVLSTANLNASVACSGSPPHLFHGNVVSRNAAKVLPFSSGNYSTQ